MPNLLAKATQRPKTKQEIAALLLSVETAGNNYLVQDHYTVEGSVDERLKKLAIAYHTFRRAQPDDGSCCFRWSWPLAYFDDSILVYDYTTDGYAYFSIPYTIEGNNVTFGIPVEVSVALVVRALGSDVPGGVGDLDDVETPTTVNVGDAGGTVVSQDNPTVDADEALIQAAISDPNRVLLQSNPMEFKILSQSVKEENGKKYRYLKIGVTQADAINSQKQVYLRQAWDNNFDRLQRLAQANRLYGQLEHPKTGENQRGGLTLSAVLWQSFTWDTKEDAAADGREFNPNLMIGQCKVLDTEPHGANLVRILEAGGVVDASSRGYGTVKQGEWDGHANVGIVDPDSFVCVTFDIVQHASSPGSSQIETVVQSPEPTPNSATQRVQTMEPSAETPTAAATTPTNPQAPAVAPATQSATAPAPAPTTTVTPAVAAAAPVVAPATAPVAQGITDVESARAWALSQSDQGLFRTTRAGLVASAQETLSETGIAAYQSALNRVPEGDLVALKQTSDLMLEALKVSLPKPLSQAAEPITGMPHFYVVQDTDKTAPQTFAQLVDRMVRDLPERYQGITTVDQSKPSHLWSPREAVRRVMYNIAQSQEGNFNGMHAAKTLLALEQKNMAMAEDVQRDAMAWMHQSLPDGATTTGGWADGGGAPTSNYMIFPLIRRTYMMLIMGELAAIQPMDRPEGKVFYLDHYRTGDGGVASNQAYEKRIDLNTSSVPFNSSYANSAGEGAAIKQMRLRLVSLAITATNKKLGASWPVEEMQDLRAYHGLDASLELSGAMGKEMAQERNMEFLNMLLAGATAGSLTFGTQAPAAGFDNQKDWDEYLWVYLNKLDNMIFSKRNNNMTHLVVGVDAALALAKSSRGVFNIGEGARGDMEMYPGTTFYGTAVTPLGQRLRVFKTNFMPTGVSNGSKVLALRRGSDWSDTPAVYAPYATFTSGIFVDPADLTQKQAIMDRAAMKVLVGDCMAVLDIDTNAQGQVL